VPLDTGTAVARKNARKNRTGMKTLAMLHKNNSNYGLNTKDG